MSSRAWSAWNGCRAAVRYWLREVVGGASHRRRWKRAGIDVTSVPLRQLGLRPDRAHNHACSGGPDLARVLKALNIHAQHSILDLGCGKGGALLTMAEFPFGRIVGLDLSEQLLVVAAENLRKAGVDRVELLHGDATLFDDYDPFTHVYMYNPFPSPVMQAVIEHLKASLRRAPRELTIIYKNPVCHDDILRSGIFRLVHRFDHAGHPFFVYQSQSVVKPE